MSKLNYFRKISIALIIGCGIPIVANAGVESEIHKMCSSVMDYKGCVEINSKKSSLPKCNFLNKKRACYGEKTFENADNPKKEDVYVGEFLNDMFHGKGTYTYADGTIYKGQFSENYFQGKGTLIWGEGEWEGDKYVGEFFKDERTGNGIYTSANGDRYVGEFLNGEPHGQGTQTWNSGEWEGDKYVGDWVNGQRSGKGTYTWANGDRYVGEFLNNESHGQGKYTWEDGDSWNGIWVNGEQVKKNRI